MKTIGYLLSYNLKILIFNAYYCTIHAWWLVSGSLTIFKSLIEWCWWGNYMVRSDFLDDLQSAIQSASGDALCNLISLFEANFHLLSENVQADQEEKFFIEFQRQWKERSYYCTSFSTCMWERQGNLDVQRIFILKTCRWLLQCWPSSEIDRIVQKTYVQGGNWG